MSNYALDDAVILTSQAPRNSKKCDKINLPLIAKSMSIVEKKNAIKSSALPQISRSLRLPRNSGVYRYKLMPGNNSRVILQALRKRPWWHSFQNSDDDSSLPTFIWEMYRTSNRYKDSSHRTVLLNHLQNNRWLVTKKGLYLTLKEHFSNNFEEMSKIHPLTFYLASCATSRSMKNDDMDAFMAYNDSLPGESAVSSSSTSPTDIIRTKDTSIWIMKPASKTNRGFGITVIQGLDAVLELVNRAPSRQPSRECTDNPGAGHGSASQLTTAETDEKNLTRIAKRIAQQDGWIVQQYMERPLLVRGRKFDIRCFVLVTHCQRKGLNGYFYNEAYVRTSCKKYSLAKLSDRETHLTNDAVQKNSKNYGAFEDGNKLSLEEWQTTINEDYPSAPLDVVKSKIFPAIKELSLISLEAGAANLCKSDIQRSFELFGYDYMIDADFNPILIEINTNPCLEFVCPLLTRLITQLIDNTFTLAVDPYFQPPRAGQRTKASTDAIAQLENEENNFQHFFTYNSTTSSSKKNSRS